MTTPPTPCPLFINGEWITPQIPTTPVFSPSTGGAGAALRSDLSR